MHERQVLAPLFPRWVFSLTRVRLPGRLSRAVTVGLTTATLLSAIPNALASGNTSKGGEALQDSGRRQPPLTKEEIQSVLPLLSKYFETRQLLADLESSIQQGDLTRAKHLVEQLREANTFEALTSNWLNGPALQSRGGPNQRASAPAEATEIHELRKALEDERERSRSLAREHAELTDKLANVQSSQERGTAASTEASEVKSALTAERERRQGLEQEVASLTGSVQERQERGAAAEAELRQALDQERERRLSLAREHAELTEKLASIQTTQSILSAAQNRSTTSRGTAQPDSSRTDVRIPPSKANSVVTRAEALLRTGDISGARLLLERAADVGDAAAVFLLAQTFDPRVLASLGVLGVRGDAHKAEELYARARALQGQPSSGLPTESVR